MPYIKSTLNFAAWCTTIGWIKHCLSTLVKNKSVHQKGACSLVCFPYKLCHALLVRAHYFVPCDIWINANLGTIPNLWWAWLYCVQVWWEHGQLCHVWSGLIFITFWLLLLERMGGSHKINVAICVFMTSYLVNLLACLFVMLNLRFVDASDHFIDLMEHNPRWSWACLFSPFVWRGTPFLLVLRVILHIVKPLYDTFYVLTLWTYFHGTRFVGTFAGPLECII